MSVTFVKSPVEIAVASAVAVSPGPGFDAVQAGASPDYIPALATVVERVRPDVLFVQSSHEIETVARHRDVFERLGAKVLADGVRGIEIASYKARMHAACG